MNNDFNQGNYPPPSDGNKTVETDQGTYYNSPPGNGQQPPYSQSPYGQDPYAQQPPYGYPPYGQSPFGPPPINPFAPVNDSKGNAAQALGIASLIGFVFCQLICIVCGILAIINAKQSREMLGYETSAAKTGRICGMIGLIVGIASFLFVIGFYALIMIIAGV